MARRWPSIAVLLTLFVALLSAATLPRLAQADFLPAGMSPHMTSRHPHYPPLPRQTLECLWCVVSSGVRYEEVDCDVVIGGGSTAALAASLASARTAPAKKICLVESTNWPGTINPSPCAQVTRSL
jgi:hypothetical protein